MNFIIKLASESIALMESATFDKEPDNLKKKKKCFCLYLYFERGLDWRKIVALMSEMLLWVAIVGGDFGKID